MAKIHKFQKVHKTNSSKADTSKRARLPVFATLVNSIRTGMAGYKRFTYDESWNAAYKLFILLRSITRGIRKLEVSIVNSTFKVQTDEVEAVVMDYSDWLYMKLLAEKVRSINSYSFSFEILDNRSIGAVIRAEHSEISQVADNLVAQRRIDVNSGLRRSSNQKITLVNEFYFVYIRDVGLYGMVKARHQELKQKDNCTQESSAA